MNKRKIIHIVLNSGVVLLAVTIIGTVGAWLPYLEVHRKTTLSIQLIVGGVGLAGIIYQVWTLNKSAACHDIIGELLAEGQRLALDLENRRGGRNVDEFPNRTVRDHSIRVRAAGFSSPTVARKFGCVIPDPR